MTDKSVLPAAGREKASGPDDDVLLRVEHLSKHFGSVKAVDDVSFVIRRGEVFGLVGESGCGKTTTGRCIIGLYEPDSGRIFFRGEHVDRRHGKGRMQMIFQDPIGSLDPRMTVRDIIAEGLVIRGERDRKKTDRKVREMMETVGLQPELAGRYPHEFSGGERQRIGVARALITQPEMIIADEPVSALDVSVQAQVINLLNDLKERFSLTLLFIAHDLSVVRYFSDRIGVMHRGRLVETAPSDELFLNPLHPYTRSLLSAIPPADPIAAGQRKRIVYDPSAEPDSPEDRPSLREPGPEHFVMCSEAEYERLRTVPGTGEREGGSL